MQGLELGDREGKKRRVRCVTVGQRDDLSGLDLPLAETLDDSRADRDRGRDLLRVAPPHLQPLQPVVHLVGRQLAREGDQPEAPGGDIDLVLLSERQQPREERHGLVVGGEVWVNRLVGFELGEPENRVLDLALFEQRDELVAEASGRQVADEPHLDR